MMYLASGNQQNWISTKLIATELQIPGTFLSRINMQLVKAGLLESQRGARGGVRLAKDPATISVYEMVTAVDGPCLINKCLAQPEDCDFPMAEQYKKYWQTIQACMDTKLKESSLKDLIGNK